MRALPRSLLFVLLGLASAGCAKPVDSSEFELAPYRVLDFGRSGLCPAISPDDHWLAVNDSKFIRVYDLNDIKQGFDLATPDSPAVGLAFVGNRYLVSTHSRFGVVPGVVVWDMSTRKSVAQAPVVGAPMIGERPILAVPDKGEMVLVAAGGKPDLLLLEVPSLATRGRSLGKQRKATLNGAAFLPGGRSVLIPERDGFLCRYDLDERGDLTLSNRKQMGSSLVSLVVHPDGGKLAVSCGDAVLLVKSDTFETIHKITGFQTWHHYPRAFSPSGKELGTSDGIFRVEDGQRIRFRNQARAGSYPSVQELSESAKPYGRITTEIFFRQGKELLVATEWFEQSFLGVPPGQSAIDRSRSKIFLCKRQH
jgi:WD40 repeat protein